MKKITMFYLEGCPYCRYADQAFEDLYREDPAYREIEVERIDENRQPELAQQYGYYYVPSLFFGKEKLYEAHPSEDFAACRAKVKAALDAIR